MKTRKFANLLSFSHFMLRRFDRDRCPQVAASLTYTTLLSLVPLITIALTMFSAFPVFESLMVEFKIFMLTHMVPDVAGRIITVYMQQFSEKAARLTAVGIAFLAVTATMLMVTIDRAFNAIWRVSRQRTVFKRLLNYWALLTLGPLLVGASLSLTSYLIGLSLGWGQITELGEVLLKLTPVLLTTVAFSLMYLSVPNRYVPVSHACAGGTVAAVLFETMKKGFALYVTQFPTYTLVYGAFAAIPIFLLWIYLSWLVVLIGAEVAASLSYWQGGAWRLELTPARHFYEALRVLRVLYSAQQEGASVSLRRLRRTLHLGFEDLEGILECLADAGLARRTDDGGWVALRSAESVSVGEVFRHFVYRVPQTFPHADAVDLHLAAVLTAIGGRCDEGMGRSLQSLFSGKNPETDGESTVR
ncbi:MAG: YihY family inner membrane protein [Burkholderiales bacterium]